MTAGDRVTIVAPGDPELHGATGYIDAIDLGADQVTVSLDVRCRWGMLVVVSAKQLRVDK